MVESSFHSPTFVCELLESVSIRYASHSFSSSGVAGGGGGGPGSAGSGSHSAGSRASLLPWDSKSQSWISPVGWAGALPCSALNDCLRSFLSFFPSPFLVRPFPGSNFGPVLGAKVNLSLPVTGGGLLPLGMLPCPEGTRPSSCPSVDPFRWRRFRRSARLPARVSALR